MKRLSLFLVSLLMVCFFTACSGGEGGDKKAEPTANTENAAAPSADANSQPAADPNQQPAADPTQTAPAPTQAEPVPAQ
ncbi:MAG: hypothetical protein A3F18_08225 [Legionellales bacterium RIFCSPHIGHO2_12_FULL_37_14]|nr:MAG: hypothetical protein A3F18_08225 [Legionellales bacterium RIFCSPHIGHO2_12_FULL_37_14]